MQEENKLGSSTVDMASAVKIMLNFSGNQNEDVYTWIRDRSLVFATAELDKKQLSEQ